MTTLVSLYFQYEKIARVVICLYLASVMIMLVVAIRKKSSIAELVLLPIWPVVYILGGLFLGLIVLIKPVFKMFRSST